MSDISVLQTERYKYQPEVPEILKADVSKVQIKTGDAVVPEKDAESIKEAYPQTYGMPIVTFVEGKNDFASKPHRTGILLSGGQAPGGHNVICGLFDGLKAANPESELFGFHLGPGGLVANDYEVLTADRIDQYRNTGGFDMIGSGRTKIETKEQIEAAIKNVTDLRLDSLVIVGGDDSNTNAAFLAEQFKQRNLPVQVIGVPKTIDGDLKNEYIETSFGFDTATKVYSEVIGNLARDTASAKKYWNFVKLMGRSASHIALEVGLQVHPNVTLIGEEIKANNSTLQEILFNICHVIAHRAANGENFGIVLIPEGIVEFIPETERLIQELNHCWGDYEKVFTALTTLDSKKRWLINKISQQAYYTLDQLPDEIAEQFLGLRDPHGNIMVSQIETEKLFIYMIRDYLASMEAAGTYNGKFAPLSMFYGYEGRAVPPSNFDANYCYSLGKTAFMLIANGLTGYIANVRNLAKPVSEWTAGGIPLTMMMNMEERKGKMVPVIAKSLVDLKGAPYKELVANRFSWANKTSYVYPGPIQYFGPREISDGITETLRLEEVAREKKAQKEQE
ncbi:MAG: diphosphate--fructose-6-phosphate 1-phosphotransferase [Treponema sp.]|nr:diphosphate--fructose-6-phosphate 1-phosphotransferase [Treponema sp.]